MFVITPTTRISAILKNCPQALDAIISISPAFEKLRNPILRKLLAGRVTIKDAAKIGKCSAQKFFNVLLPLGLRFEGFGDEAKGDKLIYSSFPEERKQRAVIIDVRRDLAAGIDPLDKIIEALNRLEEAELLCIVNTFEPLPLLRIIGKRGFSFEVRVDQQDNVLSWIGRENAVILGKGAKANTLRQSSFEGRVSFFSGQLQLLDVSKLEMPGPMMQILDALEKLPAGHALLVNHRKIPVLLFAELHENGFLCDVCEISEGNVQLLFYRLGDIAGREDEIYS
ncbi:MAG: DUF2249 domain-containing protein [Bacteroidota bacterium]|nr:DUF2249 domain-containing protein [Bacteroidota bacterium]